MDSTAASLEMMEVGEEALTATMVMEEERRAGEQKASEEKRDGLFDRAKKGLEKIKEKLLGKTMLRNKDDNSIRIVKDPTVRKEDEEEFNISDLVEDGEDVSVEEEDDRGKDKMEGEKKSRNGSGQRLVATVSWGTWRMRKRIRNWKRKTWKTEKGREKR